MGISTPANTVNIFQTVLSTQFQTKTFTVVNANTKIYDLGSFSSITSDVVLVNGLFQASGPFNSYTLVGTDIIFNEDTILSVGAEIVVYFDGLV